MSPITVLENEYATMVYFPEDKIVQHVIHQPFTGQAFRDFLMCGTELLREKKAEKWLSDDRKNMALAADDVEWGDTVWFTQTKEAGWKYWALVVPANLEGQWSLTSIVQRYSQERVQTKVFTNAEDALAWLRSV